MSRTIADFSAPLAKGGTVSLVDRLGKVVLVVNTASRCGFTPQYAGLERIWQQYRDRGFEVLAFPCNQFGHQEPGSDAEIAQFCAVNYGVSFPVMAKVEVNGPDALPLFTWLKAEAPGIFGSQGIKWNFTKFLIDRRGQPVRRFGPRIKPEKLQRAIEHLL